MAEKEKNTDPVSMQEQIASLIKATEDTLADKNEKQLSGIVLQLATLQQQIKVAVTSEDLKVVGELKAQIDELNGNIKKNQTVIDQFVANESKRTVENKDFDSGWKDLMNKNIFSKKEEEIVQAVTHKDFRMSLELKVADMTSGAHVTGDVVHSYNNRQGLVPSQNINFRDLIPTTISPTGSFVTYRETGTTGSISVQTEGQAKTQIDYSFTEVKTVSKYIAGFVVFSKQLMFNLPWLNSTLPRLLIRDFYKKENDYLYDAMIAAATGDASTPAVPVGPANDVEEIIFWIANQRTADYNASAGIIDWTQWAHLMKTGRNANSTYALPLSAGVVSNGLSKLDIDGVPIIGASWADAGEFLLYDRDFVERVETSSLRVEFSFEDSDNFRKNLITARVECHEELNVLRPNSIIHGEFGGS